MLAALIGRPYHGRRVPGVDLAEYGEKVSACLLKPGPELVARTGAVALGDD